MKTAHNGVETLVAIGLKAITAHRLTTARKQSRENLIAAYNAWKNEEGIDRVERDSPDWNAMMEATHDEYAAWNKARTDERNALRRLETACRKVHLPAAD